jgi:hypothetical protein
MRRFNGYRPYPTQEFIDNGWTNTLTSASKDPDYQGIEFDDGVVSVRWITQYRSTSHWDNMDTFMMVYGHPDSETYIEWLDK